MMLDDKQLTELVKEREKQAAVGDGKAAAYVKDVKRSMALKMDRFTNRKQEVEPEKKVVNIIQSDDPIRAENERKRREEEYRKRISQIRSKYSRDKSEDKYNRDYSY